MAKVAIVIGAGGSWAAPAGRPLFVHVRRVLTGQLGLPITDEQWSYLAPEALLSRLQKRRVNVDAELRRMLSGGWPNALHYAAAQALGRGAPVWTPNFDELIEAAADTLGVGYHVVLPHDDPRCGCSSGHLYKVHGTLSGQRVIARSEDVLLPLPAAWAARLREDLDGAEVAIVGYAGADVDLRVALREALAGCARAVWLGTPHDDESLRRRFAEPLATGRLSLRFGERPDLEFLNWAAARKLTVSTPANVDAAARGPLPELQVPSPLFVPSPLLRARVLDDYDGARAHDFYRYAIRKDPDRAVAARAYLTSGLIHGDWWRAAATALLAGACSLPVRWAWPHRYLLIYNTFNAPPPQRWRNAQRALQRTGQDPSFLFAAASAAKEVDPRSAVTLARRAQRHAELARQPANAAWATFSLSFALRWLGRVDEAGQEATRLADGFDSLAKPVWIAWGHFELGAVAVLRGDPAEGVRQMEFAREVFAAAGTRNFVFDATCGAIAAHRLGGSLREEKALREQARRMLDRGERLSRFAREVLLVEDAELARLEGRLDEAEQGYRELARSPTLAQELLGLLGLGEVQRRRGERVIAARHALERSQQTGFGFGVVHAAVTLGLAKEIDEHEAERLIAGSGFMPPSRDGFHGLRRYCVGPDADAHVICFP